MFIHFVQLAFSLVISTQLVLDGQLSPSLKRKMALIVPDGYCSGVTLRSWHVHSPGTSRRNNRISNSPPQWRKDGTPSCQAWLEVGKIRRVAHSGNLHKCSSHCKFVSGDLGTWVPRVSLNGQPILFPGPLVGLCHKVSSGRLRSSCRDISQQGPQTSPARELVTVQSWHYKYQDIFIAPFRRNLQVKKIAPEYEVLLSGGVDAAFSIWDLVFHVLVQCPVFIFPCS